MNSMEKIENLEERLATQIADKRLYMELAREMKEVLESLDMEVSSVVYDKIITPLVKRAEEVGI